ncbi:MAG: type II toxin-antitoxin system HicB family antitoxin [Bacillota bacterium]|nr:type II toxin-antitoxin system HicB family antitoxin [Bacillota bacterium]
MKYVYPVIFTPLPSGEYDVRIPDLPGCITCGHNLVDAIEMAEDAASMWLCDAEDNQEIIPAPSENLAADHPKFVNLILVDTDLYRKEKDNRAMKKTLVHRFRNVKAPAVAPRSKKVYGIKRRRSLRSRQSS